MKTRNGVFTTAKCGWPPLANSWFRVQISKSRGRRKIATVPYDKTILVVEDDPNDQTFILEAFRSIGVEAPIQVVSSGSEAIAYLMGEAKYSDRTIYAFPSFIMTDLNMAKGDGFSVLEHLRANPEWAIIPTVVLSNSVDPDDIKKAYMLGASSYHHKPASQAELCDQLQILHDYWMSCMVPEESAALQKIQNKSGGKSDERLPHVRVGRRGNYEVNRKTGS
jgi:CheY-like chemotaxis protein